MNIQTEKIRIAKTILDTEDISVIQAVDKALKQAQNNDLEEIIGSKPDGTPITRADLLAGLAISEKEFEEGNYSELNSLIKEWDIQV